MIHLQLVQFQPGLCQIGSNQEENHILIQELLQLLEKLQKHEPEVLAVVEKKQKERLRMRRDAGRKQKQDEELKEAMKASLSEGWSLLLRLLERRLEVLQMASDVFGRVTEFAAGIDRLEDLQIKADKDKLTEVQLSFDFIRKDLLGKSLQVLTSSSLLLQKLRQLQRTEALQRTGRVLQDGEAEAEQSSNCSQHSRGAVLQLEELVEALQDRRRRADQAFRLQLQQAEALRRKEESNRTGSGTRPKSPSQNQNRLKSGSTSELHPRPWSEPGPLNQPEVLKHLNPEPGSRLQEPEPDLHLNFQSRLNDVRDLESGPGSAKTGILLPSFRSGQTTGTSSVAELVTQRWTQSKSGSETRTLQSESSSAENTDLQTGSSSDQKTPDRKYRPEPRTGPRSGSEINQNQQLVENRDPALGSVLKTRPRFQDLNASGSDVNPGSGSGGTNQTRLETDEKSQRSGPVQKPRPGSEETRTLLSESSSAESRDSKRGSWSEPEPKNRPKSELLTSGSKEGKDLWPGFGSGQTVKQLLGSGSEENQNQHLGSGSEENQNQQLGSGSEKNQNWQLGTRSEENRNRNLGSGSDWIRNLKLGCRSDIVTETRSETLERPRSSSEIRLDLQNRPKSDVLRSGPQETENLSPRSGPKKTRKQNQESTAVQPTEPLFGLGSVELQRCGSDPDLRSKLEENQESGSRPEVSGSGSDPPSEHPQPDGFTLQINKQQNQNQMETQQNQEGEKFSGGNQERLMKTLQDLNCVSELLDSITQVDLGSELQTSRLLERFRQAEPHFRYCPQLENGKDSERRAQQNDVSSRSSSDLS
ncbi:PREDICTED: pinin-like [Cyprinodon variegatus]|uniref:pinin-like n=1 Tax=Cyprinodon variegatus TaxID=28743 RepID=UPI000742BBBB|nr:PREDICTED: pinin-like [Cyprinodon variegatus]